MAQIGRLATARRILRNRLMQVRNVYFNKVWGMHIGDGCAISFSAKLDKAHPGGIWIGKDSAVIFGAAILAHDTVRGMHVDTRIGERCSIGAHSLVMPGVTIGDGSIVAAGSVVMRDVPPGCMVFGNPARVLETGIVTGKWGIIKSRESKPDTVPATAA